MLGAYADEGLCPGAGAVPACAPSIAGVVPPGRSEYLRRAIIASCSAGAGGRRASSGAEQGAGWRTAPSRGWAPRWRDSSPGGPWGVPDFRVVHPWFYQDSLGAATVCA